MIAKIVKITLLQVGKTKDSYVEEGIEEYVKRLHGFCDLEIVTLKESTGDKGRMRHVEEESKMILEKLSKYTDYHKILLGIKAKNPTSEEFAAQIKNVRDFGSGKILFLVGGPYGVSENVISACDSVLSFGNMTFTHQMIRLMLLEQIYRAFTIIIGKEYHY